MDIKSTLVNSLEQSSAGKIDELADKGSRANDIAKVKKLAKDFESIFLEQMFKSIPIKSYACWP